MLGYYRVPVGLSGKEIFFLIQYFFSQKREDGDGIVAAVIGIAAASAAVKTPCIREPRGSNTEDDMLEERFEKWYAPSGRSKRKGFGRRWLEETDNATHFKSKENLLFWSERPSKYKEFIKMVWVEYGCPVHGKGPWDGLGAMAKTKVTRDLTEFTHAHRSIGYRNRNPQLLGLYFWDGPFFLFFFFLNRNPRD